jgi:DNA-binding transcriptional MerR regulator
MSTHTIKDAAKLTGMPESTLRYYETIGLLDAVTRDPSSKHRIYSDEDINLAIAVACLSATGMSIGDMRSYLGNRTGGKDSAVNQVDLLEMQKRKLSEEAHYLTLRQRYVDIKIDYWRAVQEDDNQKVESMRLLADTIAKELKQTKLR